MLDTVHAWDPKVIIFHWSQKADILFVEMYIVLMFSLARRLLIEGGLHIGYGGHSGQLLAL
jgi:hypothetical protein